MSFRPLHFLAIIIALSSSLVAAPATTRFAAVTPEAAALLEAISQAYTKLDAMESAGKITGEFDVDGQTESDSADFSSSFSTPNQFRLNVAALSSLGSDGKRLYVFSNARNSYLTADAPRSKTAIAELPDPFNKLIVAQDLSLALALSSDPAAEMSRDAGRIEKSPDLKLDGRDYQVITLSLADAQGTRTLLVDPKTHLLRRVSSDLSAQLRKRGAGEVKQALVTIDYTIQKPNPTTQPHQFAWSPPAGSRDAQDVPSDGGGGAADMLVGKPAPDFKLKDLSDQEVELTKLNGHVVVLDFWATWCGPCVASLPKLDALAREMKDEDVKFFAVNQSEEKELVGGFMTSRNLTIPVLLDSDSKVGRKYEANAIPQTVVIGRDGHVRKVFIGAGPDTETKLREAIEQALRAGQ